jgi:hypothetical protein
MALLAISSWAVGRQPRKTLLWSSMTGKTDAIACTGCSRSQAALGMSCATRTATRLRRPGIRNWWRGATRRSGTSRSQIDSHRPAVNTKLSLYNLAYASDSVADDPFPTAGTEPGHLHRISFGDTQGKGGVSKNASGGVCVIIRQLPSSEILDPGCGQALSVTLRDLPTLSWRMNLSSEIQ